MRQLVKTYRAIALSVKWSKVNCPIIRDIFHRYFFLNFVSINQSTSRIMSQAAAAQAKFVNDINRINSRLEHQFQSRLKEMNQDLKQLSRSYDLRKFEIEIFLKKILKKNSDQSKLSIKLEFL